MKKALICLSIVAILMLCLPNVATASMGKYSTTFHNNARHTGDYITTSMTSSPAVANGIVYIGSEDNNVYALDTNTGAKIWSYTTENVVYSSPTVANGIVYIGSEDNNVYALNATTGTKVWNYTTGDIVVSNPAVANGIVYVVSWDHNVYALDATTGTKVWSYATGDIVVSNPAVANDIVYVDYGHTVYALNAHTGTKMWGYTTESNVTSSPTITNGIVYVGSAHGNIYALDANTGAKVWNYTTTVSWSDNPPLFCLYSPAVVANGIVYVGSSDSNIYALNASTGTKIWIYPSAGVWVLSSPTVANGIVYVGSVHTVYALKVNTGKMVWRETFDGNLLSSPAVANGVVYIGVNDNLYALHVYALHANTGNVVWSNSNGFIWPTPTPTAPLSITNVKLVPGYPRYLMWEVSYTGSGYASVAPNASLYATNPTSPGSKDEGSITAQYVYDTVTKTLSNTTISFGYGWAQVNQGHTYLFISGPVVPSDAKWAMYNAQAWYDGKFHDSLYVFSPYTTLR